MGRSWQGGACWRIRGCLPTQKTHVSSWLCSSCSQVQTFCVHPNLFAYSTLRNSRACAPGQQVISTRLLPRFAFLGSPRIHKQLQNGLEDSPMGCVTFVAINVVGVSALMAWDEVCLCVSIRP